MNESDHLETQPMSARDPLGELIRAAGRRPPPPREHYDSVLAVSRSAWQSTVRARRRRRWYALAAAVVIALGSGVVIQSLERAPAPAAALAVANGEIALFSAATGRWQPLSGVDTQVFPGDRLRTGAVGRAALATLDGGSLRLDSATEIALNGASTVELVAGTLYVDSGRMAPVNAIEVATRFGRVRDIGTQFEVRSSAESLRVRVRTGVVELVQSLYAADFQSPAGEEFELLTSGAVQLREIAPDDDQWAWTATLAVAPNLDNQSILGYLQWIAHETGKSLRFDSPNTELRAQLVSFRADARGFTPLEILESITRTSDFTYELTEDGAILVRRSDP
jgi:ferric-dicitrate binding protein FerR (iron transport regulator)